MLSLLDAYVWVATDILRITGGVLSVRERAGHGAYCNQQSVLSTYSGTTTNPTDALYSRPRKDDAAGPPCHQME